MVPYLMEKEACEDQILVIYLLIAICLMGDSGAVCCASRS